MAGQETRGGPQRAGEPGIPGAWLVVPAGPALPALCKQWSAVHRPHGHPFSCPLPAPLPPTLPQQLPEMLPGLAVCSPGVVGGRGPRPGLQGLEAPLTHIWALRGWPGSPLPVPPPSPTLNFLGCSPGNLKAEFLLGLHTF